MIVEWREARARYEALTSYHERLLPKGAGWHWDAEHRCWHTAGESQARLLARWFSREAMDRLQRRDRRAEADAKLSAAHGAEIDVPCPPDLAFLPYQKAGIAYATGRPSTLFADEMGLGKTVQAIGVANMLKPTRVLIICPATLRLNWLAEWRRWSVNHCPPFLVGGWPMRTENLALIVSYDSVHKWREHIDRVRWDLLICDEAHLMKDPGTRRTRSILGGRARSGKPGVKAIEAKTKLFLTGTPIVNRPLELFPLLHALDPNGLGRHQGMFKMRYGGGQNLDELHHELRRSVMVRRLKADVLTELPAKRRQVVLLEVHSVLAGEATAMRAIKAKYEAALASIEGLEHRDQVRRLTEARGIAMTELSRIRHETAVRKLPAVVEHIHEMLTEAQKIVVFAHHHDVLDGLAGAFPQICVRLDGRSSEQERAEAVTRFQNDNSIRLFVGGIRAAGLGITLTASDTVLFAELDWTPSAMSQAEDRLHRIGQKKSVLVQHLVVDGSIDAKMAKLIVAKQTMIGQAIDGNIVEEILR